MELSDMTTFKNITVLGTGVLGSQIAYQTAFRGFQVPTVWDIDGPALERAKERLAQLASVSASEVEPPSPDAPAGRARADPRDERLRRRREGRRSRHRGVPENLELGEDDLRDQHLEPSAQLDGPRYRSAGPLPRAALREQHLAAQYRRGHAHRVHRPGRLPAGRHLR